MKRLENLTLELSLKPFGDLRGDAIANTCERIWTLWRPLIVQSRRLSVMLWVGSGDEILTWTGDPDQPLSYAHHIGFCNYEREGAYDPANPHYRINRAQPLWDNPPRHDYNDLARIIAALRSTAKERFGIELSVGATIDPGPEFAESAFRYETHAEILQPIEPNLPLAMRFISHQATLKGDRAKFAGFPDGVPDGATMGTFLGRQFNALSDFAGFDFLWLSNGFGYADHPWAWYGRVFDGLELHQNRIAEEREKTNRFWRDFRKACPDTALEVRGTNFSIAMDLATDGCSHVDINRIGDLLKLPCNPPWGSRALGLEMVSYLSRLAKTPSSRLPFRFYLNDPWFVATPWYDYYGQEPFDVYSPMTASRLTADGSVEAPTDLAFLSIDGSNGSLDADEAAEAIPHMVSAFAEKPDAPGPVIWIYPFDEYHDLLHKASPLLPGAFAHDWFVCRALEEGLAMNTVCSSDVFVSLAKAGKLPEATWIAPAPLGDDWAYADALLRHVEGGGRAIVYGSLAHAPDALRDALGVELAEPLEGDFELAEQRLAGDAFERDVEPPQGPDPTLASIGYVPSQLSDAEQLSAADRPLRHHASVSGGGIRETADFSDPALRTIVKQGDERRAYAIHRQRDAWNGGRLMWHRGSVSFDPAVRRLEPTWDPPHQAHQPAAWLRSLLNETGFEFVQQRADEATRASYAFVKRVSGAWVYTGHQPDTTVRLRFKTSDGAPAFEEYETRIVDGYAEASFGKTFHKPVRVFVRMPDGRVSVKRLAIPVGQRVHFSVAGLRDADVTIYADSQAIADDAMIVRSQLHDDPVSFETDRARCAVHVRNHTGSLYIQW